MELRDIPRMLSPASFFTSFPWPHHFHCCENLGSKALFGCKFLWWKGLVLQLPCYWSDLGLLKKRLLCVKHKATRVFLCESISNKCLAFSFAKGLLLHVRMLSILRSDSKRGRLEPVGPGELGVHSSSGDLVPPPEKVGIITIPP